MITLEQHNPNFLKEWDYEKNSKTPADYSHSSAKKVWWKCPTCNYSWEATINSRYKNTNCKKCSGKLLIKGENDLATIRPEIISWWNDTTEPSDYFPKSNKIINWKCPKGHEFTKSIKKFNFYCKECSLGVSNFKQNNSLANKAPQLIKEWNNTDLNPNQISYSSAKLVEWKCNQGHTWTTPVYSRYNGTNCPKCVIISKTSKDEKEIENFLIKNQIKFEKNNRTILNGKELDFYFPDKQIAIEYNGLYWHCEKDLKDKNYHYNKWKACQEKNIQLITIWEDDYKKNKDLINKMILHKLVSSNEKRIGARKLKLEEISYQQASEFLNENHIQGSSRSSFYLALLNNEKNIVAVSNWKFSNNRIILDRYATNQVVIGGLGKMISYVQNKYHKTIETFAAHDISNGNLYEKIGFIKEYEIKPDYTYFYNGHRVHKFNFRKSRFKIDPHLKYEENLSETQLAELNNIYKIWDTGKTKYILPI